MNEVWLYSALPAIAAATCLFLLKNLIQDKSNIDSILLFAILTILNTSQALGNIFWSYGQPAWELYGDSCLITAYFLFTQFILFAMSRSAKPPSNIVRAALYAFPISFSLLHLNGLMVEGYRVENNVLLHNDGLLAWCFDLFVILSCVATAVIFKRNKREASSNEVDISKKVIAPISFLPAGLILLILIVLSHTEYVISAVVISPVVSIYIATAFYYLQREKVIDLSFGLSFFVSRLKLANQLLEMDNSKSELRDYKKEIEKLFILEVLDKHNGNIQETADYLAMNHTTVRNKIKEYEISLEPKKYRKQQKAT